MTYNEKKSLYESIIKDVAKSVKRQINETNNLNDYSFSDVLQFALYDKSNDIMNVVQFDNRRPTSTKTKEMLSSIKRIIYKFFLMTEKENENCIFYQKTFDDIELTQQENEEFEILTAESYSYFDMITKIKYRLENEDSLKKYKQFILQTREINDYYRKKIKELFSNLHIESENAQKFYFYFKKNLEKLKEHFDNQYK